MVTITVCHRGQPVFRFDDAGLVTLHTMRGNPMAVSRINAAARQFGLALEFKHEGQGWRLERGGVVIPFRDGDTVNPVPTMLDKFRSLVI